MNNKTIFSVWKDIFSRPTYLILSVASSVLFYLANVIIQNFSNLSSLYPNYGFSQTIHFLFNLSINLRQAITLSSYLSLITISILLGILISIIVYKTKDTREKLSKKSGFLNTIGVFLAILAPGCAACGLGLIAVLGLTGAILTFLPFKGLEISVISIAILAFAILKMSKDITICKVCII